jgi:hypothetical protein
MTSIRETLRRLARRGAEQGPDAAEYSYTVHWTKVARDWDWRKREGARLAVLEITRRPEFRRSTRERRYVVPAVDDQAHAGASLLALLAVLEAIERSERETPREQP